MEMHAPKVMGRRGSRNLSEGAGSTHLLTQDLAVKLSGSLSRDGNTIPSVERSRPPLTSLRAARGSVTAHRSKKRDIDRVAGRAVRVALVDAENPGSQVESRGGPEENGVGGCNYRFGRSLRLGRLGKA